MVSRARTFFITLAAALVLGLLSSSLLADNPGIPPASDASTTGLDHLRAAIKDAYLKGDIDAMARYLHPDVVIVFPDGSILKGPDAFRDYYKRMMTAPNHRVVSYSADPQVESRTVHNDVGLSYGYMNDQYVLNDGRSFALNSRFTVTVFKSPTGPTDTDGWMIRSFHSSPDSFDNPVITMVAKGVFWRAGIGGVVVGTILGLIIGIFYTRAQNKAGST
jgi:ketosteroid isomerase-like protein